MILEAAMLDVIPGRERDFEAAFEQAQQLIAGMAGYPFASASALPGATRSLPVAGGMGCPLPVGVA